MVSQSEFPLAPDTIDIDHASCDFPPVHARVFPATWEEGGMGGLMRILLELCRHTLLFIA
jgi:hypothetical protein